MIVLRKLFKEIGKIIEKKPKISVRMSHENKKPQARKQIFIQTTFPHLTQKVDRKIFTWQNHLLYRSTSCFGGRRRNMCEQILKKNITEDSGINSK